MFDWVTADIGDLETVVQALEAARVGHGSCAVIFTLGDSGVGGSFLVHSFGESVSLEPIRNTVLRGDGSGFVDFEWYLSRVVPCLRDVGVSGFTVTDLP